MGKGGEQEAENGTLSKGKGMETGEEKPLPPILTYFHLGMEFRGGGFGP